MSNSLKPLAHKKSGRLCLTRSVGESIVMTIDGKQIRVFVDNVVNKRVSLVIEAPREVNIAREELIVRQSEGRKYA